MANAKIHNEISCKILFSLFQKIFVSFKSDKYLPFGENIRNEQNLLNMPRIEFKLLVYSIYDNAKTFISPNTNLYIK